MGYVGKVKSMKEMLPPSSFMLPPLLKLGPQIFRPVGLYLLTRKQAMTLGYSAEHQNKERCSMIKAMDKERTQNQVSAAL